jgi:hypothetical protein
MSNQIENPSQISLEQLTEAAIRGTQRALAARPPSWWSIQGPLTIGFHFDQARLLSVPIPPPLDGDPEKPDIGDLRTGLPISREAAGRVSDRITQDRELGRAFARALRADFAGTFQQLFRLTPEQYESLRALSRDREATDLLGKFLGQAFETDMDIAFTLQFGEPTAPSQASRPPKVDLTGGCTYSNGQFSATVGFTLHFGG